MSQYYTQHCHIHGEYDYDVDNPSGCPECFEIYEALIYLYGYEINCEISSFWDGGFTAKIGDSMNGFIAEKIFQKKELWEIGNWLVNTAKEKYQNIEWKPKQH